MQRLLLAVVVLLVAVLLGRDARVEKADQIFLRWLLNNTRPPSGRVPLTVIEIGREPLLGNGPEKPAENASEDFVRGTSSSVSPLEFALFLQSILDYKPIVVAIEPLLKWRSQDKDQEQVFLDQAMRVPKLLLGAELTTTPDPDLPATEIASFPHVSGRRGDLPSFSGIAHQPSEELRMISTLGYVNLPSEVFDEIHAPLLFQYRGEVIPSFALQAFLAWARVPLGEVKIELGSYIELPVGRRIPIRSDGSLIVNPNASTLARRMRMNELLLLAQQKPAGKTSPLESLHDELVLARTPLNPLAPRETIAATVATLQSNHFVHRVSVMFDCVVLLLIALLAWPATRVARVDLILAAIAFTAAYCLIAFALMSRFEIWVPGVVPLSATALLLLIALFSPRAIHAAEGGELAAPPPAP
jgi:hypothetical protein